MNRSRLAMASFLVRLPRGAGCPIGSWLSSDTDDSSDVPTQDGHCLRASRTILDEVDHVEVSAPHFLEDRPRDHRLAVEGALLAGPACRREQERTPVVEVERALVIDEGAREMLLPDRRDLLRMVPQLFAVVEEPSSLSGHEGEPSGPDHPGE